MLTLITVLFAALLLVALGVVAGYILGWAQVTFHVEVDPKVEAVAAALPGANCGACGFVGCGEYAEAVGTGKADINLCAPGGTGTAAKVGAIMGVETVERLPYRPVMHCVARKEEKHKRTAYTGEPTCAAANLVAGVQGCTYGCLGLGDCVRACKYDALRMIGGRPTVDYDKCIGCKACAKACPRNVITMVPWKAATMLVVGCSNRDQGLAVKEVCDVGCIGCALCSKKSPGLIRMENNLPVLDYDTYVPAANAEAPALEKCPRQSLVYVGKPRPKDVAAVTGEELPELVRGNFETTVDKTEWRG